MTYILLLAILHLFCSYTVVNRFVRPSLPSDMLIQWAILSMITFYGYPVIIGELSGYMNTATIILSALLAASGALYCRARYSPGPCNLAWIKQALRNVHPVGLILSVPTGLFLLLTFYTGLALPVRAWDAGGYHILNAIRWDQSGKFINDSFGNITDQMYCTHAINFPNLKAVLPFMILLWTGNDAGTALAQWPYLILLTVALYGLYRRMGLTHIFSLIGIWVCITAPEIILQSVEMYADLTLFAGTVLVLWLCLKTWQDGFTIKDILPAAFAFGLFLSTKPNALPLCAGFGALYLLIGFLRNNSTTKIGEKIRHMTMAFAVIVIGCRLLAGAWLVQGILEFDNPVYPIKVTIANHTIFDGPSLPDLNDGMVKQFTGRTGLDAKLGTLAEKWRPPSIASWSSGLGAPTFIIGLPCVIAWLLLLIISGRKTWHNGVPIAVFGFALLYATCPTPEVARFSLFLLALTGMAIGITAQILHLVPRLALGILTMGLCGYNIYVTGPSIIYRSRSPQIVAFNLFSGNTQATRQNLTPLQYDPICYWLDNVAAKGTRLAISPEVPIWDVYKPGAKNDIVRVHAKPWKTFESWKSEVIGQECTHLLIARSFEYYDEVVKCPEFKLLSNRIVSTMNPDAGMNQPFNGSLFEVVKP